MYKHGHTLFAYIDCTAIPNSTYDGVVIPKLTNIESTNFEITLDNLKMTECYVGVLFYFQNFLLSGLV